MVIIDKMLQARQAAGNPIRVGLIGAGEMAQGIANQIIQYTPGMEVVAIANRTLDKARQAYVYPGVETIREVHTREELEEALASGTGAITQDADLLCEAAGIDILVEATGTIGYAADVVLKAIRNRKHVLLFNPELDATLGPILKHYADQAGVLLSGSEGDQPGVILNLYRFVKSMGFKPLVCGNIKGLQDRNRNPTTQAAFAKQWNQSVNMVTSFADGTKISFEQASVANATGMGVAQRGMLGFHSQGHVDQMTNLFNVEELEALGGIVDYVVGPQPGPGVFVYATTNDPKSKQYLNLYKLGQGPLYSFYTPYHLCFFEVPNSIARVVLLNDVVMEPLGAPVVEVVATAKVDLTVGQTIDGLGGYLTYGLCENAPVARKENLLPMGLAEGAVLKRDIPKDGVLTFDDVEIAEETLVYKLFKEQTNLFFQAEAKPLANVAG
jgi:predicted homoserine dehydrogenase-like protein